MELVKPVVMDIFEFEYRDKSMKKSFQWYFLTIMILVQREKSVIFHLTSSLLLISTATFMEETQQVDTEIYDFENWEINVKNSCEIFFELSSLWWSYEKRWFCKKISPSDFKPAIETSIEEVKPIVTEKYALENRDESVSKTLLIVSDCRDSVAKKNFDFCPIERFTKSEKLSF